MSRKKRHNGAQQPVRTADGYNNFTAKLGTNTQNIQTGGTYVPGYITRNRVMLEFAYRSSFLVGAGVDSMADDMTRKGISISSKLEPGQKGKVETFWDDFAIWDGVNDVLKWSRLYGGAILVMLIDGQDMSTPLNIDRIKEGQFKGVMALDRWMVNPSYNHLVTDYGPEFGKPKFYKVVVNQQGIPPGESITAASFAWRVTRCHSSRRRRKTAGVCLLSSASLNAFRHSIRRQLAPRS